MKLDQKTNVFSSAQFEYISMIFKNTINLFTFHVLGSVLLIWFPSVIVNISPGRNKTENQPDSHLTDLNTCSRLCPSGSLRPVFTPKPHSPCPLLLTPICSLSRNPLRLLGKSETATQGHRWAAREAM